MPDLNAYRAYPFKKLDMNTYQTPSTSINLTIGSIMFINKFTFALENKGIKIPYHVKRSIINKTDNTNNTTSTDIKPTKKTTKKDKVKKLTDHNLILCNLSNLDKAVKLFLDGVSKAYDKNNFYPVLIYPKQLNILDYNQKKQHHISIHKILKPVENKHQFVFNDL